MNQQSVPSAYIALRGRYADWRHQRSQLAQLQDQALSAEVLAYLTSKNPWLLDLRQRYAQTSFFTHTFWKGWRRYIDFSRFRSEGHYLSQWDGPNPEAQYLATTVFAGLIDDWNLIGQLKEDGLFGCHTYAVGENLHVSRDLLDSIIEITFLRQTLGFDRRQELRHLDIGAGYGRFAHRLLSTFPNASIANVDGVAESTFLCDFYTRFRGLEDRSRTIPLDRLQELETGRFDLASNIHSWSECPRETVKFWVRLLRDLRVPRLFVVPHDEEFTSMEPNGRTDSFLPEITAAGYKLTHKVHKFDRAAPLKRNGVSPAWYCLFEAQ